MSGRRAVRDERLDRPPWRLPRPHDGVVGVARWLAATALLGLAALLLTAEQPRVSAAPVTAVVVARHDLPAGKVLSAADLGSVRLAPETVPAGTIRDPADAIGHAAAGPVRRGEPVTDVRLLGPALLHATGGAAAVAAPLRIADPGVVALLHPGDRVDVVAAASQAGEPPRVIATDLPVVAVPPPSSDGAAEGALVVLAAPPQIATRLVGVAATVRLSLTVHGR